MRNIFIKFILIFFIISCGGGDENGMDSVIPQNPAIIVDKTSISFANHQIFPIP